MDLKQEKLTKKEWEFLEVPVNPQEKSILDLIYNSYDNINFSKNETNSLLLYLKIGTDEPCFHYYLYQKYFENIIKKIINIYQIKWKIKKTKKASKKINTANLIRIKNSSKKIEDIKHEIIEFILIELVYKFYKNDYCPMTYYSICDIMKNNIKHINQFIIDFINFVITENKKKINKIKLIKNSFDYIEKNKIIFKYRDVELYKHQKDLFTSIKRDGPKMIYYQAPTGTGKTISPVGLARGKKVIFTCAAKHIGLQLAKSCISMEIPIAIAFGCKDPSDIRLHYFAAKDFVRHRKSGQIFRVDNSVGDKVQVIITDIQSFLPAMNYMCAFNEEKDMVWYWDEPTITLDYVKHEFHEILEKNWKQNRIPNIVLSSATLPDKNDVSSMSRYFCDKFKGANIEQIKSYECKKSIPVYSKDGSIIMPHLYFDNYKELRKSVQHIKNNLTILRHIDVKKMVELIYYVNKEKIVPEQFNIENNFENISDITIMSLKMYYLNILSILRNNYEKVYQHFQKKYKKDKKSFIKITTQDSYTLTDGPTIFISDNVKKLGLFYLKVSNIPDTELDNILKIIKENGIYTKQLDKVEKDEQQRQDKLGSKQLEKDHSKNVKSDEFKIQQKYRKTVKALKSRIKTIELNPQYIPNSKQHIKLWARDKETDNSFTSDIEDDIVTEIMYLNDVDKAYKILLLMGIGVFIKDMNKEYLDIMKALATKQKLFVIIASSDYIYGTNYQFCHGYLSKDLENMTQEKLIQALGRIGRKKSQSDYSIRFRDDSLINKLFSEEKNKPEVLNMNKLFGF